MRVRLLYLVVLAVGGFGLPGLEAEIRVEGRTLQGMCFSGVLSTVEAGTLHLSDHRPEDAVIFGIPLEDLHSLSLDLPKIPDPAVLGNLANLLPTASRWDQSSVGAVLGWCHKMEAERDWIALYRWASVLRESLHEPERSHQAGLLEATAMLELGLWKQLAASLEMLNTEQSPIRASPRLCWLNAALATRHGKVDQARFWIRLPELQLPRRPRAFPERIEALERLLPAIHHSSNPYQP